ncbi:unnamed protein product [Orchesella dallaii]|uniref:C2H2-type domain-containing protein n=1 Tax=Orchesella dallaii TaxID=48710 RepID=A0ABP1S2Q8_9HEXA
MLKEHTTTADVEGPEDDGDDLHADFEPIDPIDEAEYSSLNETHVKAAKKPPMDAAKSGERCYVCGDELLVSETLASSQETFRKACCYLNVKSKSEWFPGMDGSRFYSFCESCTNEITRIHHLYKKVDEIQSLIFKKVEDVEKRIADAEIVDNWMADAPHCSALRFEGFRKQVLINYRNKLKVRREVRVGKKMGHNFVEIQPMRSAHMFATDPAATNAFSKLAPSDNPEEAVELDNSRRVEPRRHSKRSKSHQNTMLDSPQMDDADDHIGFDDDDEWCGEEPERETKFWKDDPSKLNVGNMDTNEDSHDVEAGDDFMDGGADANVGSDSDASLNDSDDDGDWGSTQKKKKKVKKQAGNSNLNQSNKKGTPSKQTYATDKGYRFPDTIVTKDNRMYMEGVEIIKLPAGSYSRMPFNEVFMCGTCDKMMVSFWKIRQHICGHHLGMYKCSICGKEFAEPRLIPQHIERKHTERKPTECEICGRPMFARTPEAMRYHIYTHLGEEEKKDPKYANYCPPHKKDPNRPKRILAKNFQTFQCFQCGKTFLRPSALKRHELIHGGDALKVQCQHCGKMYAHRKALSDHLNICSLNTNINRQTYPCPKCPQRFKNRSTRSKHLKNHDKPSPFSCPRCPRKFSSKNGFKNHKRICTETTHRYGGISNNVRTGHAAYESNVPQSSPIASTSSSEYPTEVKASTSQQSISYYHDGMGVLQYPMGFNIHHSGGQ